MSRRLTLLTLAAGGLSLAACADAPRVTEPAAVPGPSFSRNELNHPNRHLFLTRDGYARATKPRKSSGNGISYHGGPVLQAATNVVNVYWHNGALYTNGPASGCFSTAGAAACSTTSSDNSLIGYFVSNLTSSSYYAINTTYTDGSGVAINNVVNYTGYWATGTDYAEPADGASVSDAQMVALLQYGFDHGFLKYDASTLYHIFSYDKVNLGGNFGTQYCAYHTHGTVTVNGASQTVLYSAMPYDYAYPSACTSGYAVPNGDPGADYEVNTLVHETEETTTDMMGNAWYDTMGNENADKCAWKWGTTSTAANGGVYNITLGSKQFLVQENWENANGGLCSTHWP